MNIFKAYDIRGIYGFDLTDNLAYNLGRSAAIYSKPKNIVVGYDSRSSNMKLFSAFAKGIIDSGVDVIHIGLVSRPMVNWVTWKFGYDLGVIISASHNLKEYNGFKFIGKGGVALHYDNYLVHIEKLLRDEHYVKSRKKGKIISLDYIDAYVKFLKSHFSKEFQQTVKKKKVRIVGDVSNGAAGEIIRKLLDDTNVEYELLFAEPDGNFPCHNPNPLDDTALIVLSKTVVKNKADFGFIVDPDADRIRFVDEKGQILDNNYAACIACKYLLSKDKKKLIVHDLVSRKILSEVIRRNKGKEIISRVGFAFMNENMRINDAIFGAEVSGHYSFRSMDYLDSGMMMLVTMLNALYSKNNSGKRLSTLTKPLDKYATLGEINYQFEDGQLKEGIISRILDFYKQNKKKLSVKKIMTLDGVSVYFKDSWFNIRSSNTEPLLRLRGEAKNNKALMKMKKSLEKLIGVK